MDGTTARPFPPPIQTQTPAVQSVRSAHSSPWGSEPASAVNELTNMDERRPSGDGAPLPSFLRQTKSGEWRAAEGDVCAGTNALTGAMNRDPE